ncbi:glycosyl transferase [Maribius pontilimi]|uniref:Peptide O-xylosyltransferase n=1 Tax=Palleronia pontilimi TaxID=1964209 RepID=A0A934I842_9RHOB|nr:DUF5928 domain-containing protein [Palleronia pontilimi]MBJ3762204.1 glycosyl transferase [Palleronia pontilimi]
MAQIAYLLLSHKDAPAVIAQANRVTAAGDFLAIHFDARAPDGDYQQIVSELADNPRVVVTPRRVKCGWGEWSLVEATILAARAAIDTFPRATHFYMLSGDCMPIKSAEYCRAMLEAEDCDYIEHHDFHASDWIKTGFKEERLIYRHFFNERRNKALFYRSFELQKRLGLTRSVPQDLQIMIGSQWWCLRRETMQKVLAFTDRRRDVRRFFRTTWIPDETFFQTLVHHLIPRAELRNRTLTFLIFSDYGMPVSFYDDHYDLLLSQDYLFARKISPEALALKRRLGQLYTTVGMEFDISNEGRRLFQFLAGRGRVGRRFAPRFWEKESSIGRDRELLIVTCKKWHVAKRLVDRARQHTNLPGLKYLFDEEDTELPDLGGTQATLVKRTRHRRALMRMLFDYHDTDRLMICLDPSNLALMQDFESDRSTTRILEILCDFSDQYLEGHARRVGIAGQSTKAVTMSRLLPTIRADFQFESEAINAAGFTHLYRITESDTPDTNAGPLAEFLSIEPGAAQQIAASDHLFAD